MYLWKIAGALHRPNGITKNWYWPSPVIMAVYFRCSGLILNCQYPLDASMIENHSMPSNWLIWSLMLGMGYRSFGVMSLSGPKFTQTLILPFGLSAMTTLDAYSLVHSSMTLCFSIYSISRFRGSLCQASTGIIFLATGLSVKRFISTSTSLIWPSTTSSGSSLSLNFF